MTAYIVDTSVINRQDQPLVHDRLTEIGWHRLTITTVNVLEVGVSARNADEHAKILGSLHRMFRVVAPSPWAHERAIELQSALTANAEHRSAGLPDLLIAATAEQFNVPVLHYDRDFMTLAKRTGCNAEWVCEPGTLDAGGHRKRSLDDPDDTYHNPPGYTDETTCSNR